MDKTFRGVPLSKSYWHLGLTTQLCRLLAPGDPWSCPIRISKFLCSTANNFQLKEPIIYYVLGAKNTQESYAITKPMPIRQHFLNLGGIIPLPADAT